MNELAPIQSLESSPQPVDVYVERERALKDLLDPHAPGETLMHFPNYEYAVDSGLVDIFDFDPETGEDALRHLLEGDVIEHQNGAREVSGFHHEPSARRQQTYVDREILEDKNPRYRRDFREYPFSPYNAHVVVDGYRKSSLRRNEDGSLKEVTEKSSMFPKEYDALAVMQAIRIARDTRNMSNDKEGAGGVIVTEGMTPLLDGQNTMRLRLILDKDTQKIISAFPMARRSEQVQFTPEEVHTHLGLR